VTSLHAPTHCRHIPRIFASLSCLALVPPPFPPTSRILFTISDLSLFLEYNPALAQLVGRLSSSHRLAQTKPRSARRVAHSPSSVGLGSELHRQSRDDHAVYGSFSYVFHIPFHLRRPFFPSYAFTFTLDVAFDYRRTLLCHRRFRARRREPHDHLIIFLCLRTSFGTPCIISPAVPYPSPFASLFSSSSLPFVKYLCHSVSPCV
jgi:hypothetical protein